VGPRTPPAGREARGPGRGVSRSGSAPTPGGPQFTGPVGQFVQRDVPGAGDVALRPLQPAPHVQHHRLRGRGRHRHGQVGELGQPHGRERGAPPPPPPPPPAPPPRPPPPHPRPSPP